MTLSDHSVASLVLFKPRTAPILPESIFLLLASVPSLRTKMACILRVLNCIVYQPKFMAPIVDMSGKTVVVTGPTKGGIGYETALALAKFGARVILAARNPTTAQEAAEAIRSESPSSQIHRVQCDLFKLQSVSDCAEELKNLASSGVDVLVCNAGAEHHTGQMSEEGVEKTFAVCAMGHYKLINALQPRRVVWVTGDIYVLASKLPDPFLAEAGTQAYMRACLARLWLARELKARYEVAGTPMEVVCVHPGVVNSSFSKLRAMAKRIAGAILISPELGAQASILATTAPSADIHQNWVLPYYHNKQGWLNLPKDDLAMMSEEGKRLSIVCDEICGTTSAR